MSLLENLAALTRPASRPADGSRALVRFDSAAKGHSHGRDWPSGVGAVYGKDSAPRRLSAPGSQARHLDAYAGGDDSIDWVMDCVSLIAETAASAPTQFERDGIDVVPHKTRDQPEDTEEAPGDLSLLFEQPNPYMDWSELMTLTIVDYLMTGNSWWWKFKTDGEGKPLAIFRLHPAHVTVLQSKSGGISGYEYSPPGRGGKITISPEDMVQFRRPNPHDEFYGAGVIAGSPRVFDLELYLTESQTDYYQKGTRLSGVLETDATVSPALFEKLKRTFKAFYSGRKNAYDIAVLERGLKYNTIQNSAAEANYGEMARLSRDRILAAFRVPLSLLGISGDQSTGQSKAEDQRVFDNKTMRPLLDKFQRKISLDITQAWGMDFKILYEYLPPKEDQIELAGTLGALPGIALWEVRDAAGFDPLPPLPGGEDDPRNYIVLNLPGEEENASTVKDRPLPGEGGRPPLGENTATFEGTLPTDATVAARPQPKRRGAPAASAASGATNARGPRSAGKG